MLRFADTQRLPLVCLYELWFLSVSTIWLSQFTCWIHIKSYSQEQERGHLPKERREQCTKAVTVNVALVAKTRNQKFPNGRDLWACLVQFSTCRWWKWIHQYIKKWWAEPWVGFEVRRYRWSYFLRDAHRALWGEMNGWMSLKLFQQNKNSEANLERY